MNYVRIPGDVVIKKVEETLKNIDFSQLNGIKEKLLKSMLEKREKDRQNKSRDLDLYELDQVVAAKGKDWNQDI